MSAKNNLKVRIYVPGDFYRSFEFHCSSFNTMRGDKGGKNMIVKFYWEKMDENGCPYTEYGAPKAVESMLFKLELNKNEYERSHGLNAIKLPFIKLGKNSVVLQNIENFQMSVESF